MSPPTSVLLQLRQAAPRLSRHFFSRQECCHRPYVQSRFQSSHATTRPQYRSIRQTPFLQAFRSRNSTTAATQKSSPLDALRNAVSSPAAKALISKSGSKTFPKVTDRSVSRWLYASAASVFGIVVFGGLTRLTESGLSITEWRPVTGTLPPLSEASWDAEFTKYKASPEFQQLNSHMGLSDFKRIYWMEYTHRLWGRAIGLGTLLPTIYFVARRRVSVRVARNLALINGLIVAQGVMGWWMVKSGLKDDLFAKGMHPRVSQYRLTAHLGLAFSVYVAMLWNALSINRERSLLLKAKPHRAQLLLQRLSAPALRPFRIAVAALAGLVFTTAMSGGLVAGLDAGLIYNEFPYMGLGLTPPKSELWDAFYSRIPAPGPHKDLWWRNMLENPSLVQLDHRILATSTFVAVHALFAYARFNPGVRSLLTRGGKMALSGALMLVWLQATLGVTTLIYLVPTPLAAAHQAGSLALLTSVIILGSRVWTPNRLFRAVDRSLMKVRMKQARREMWVETHKPLRNGPRLF